MEMNNTNTNILKEIVLRNFYSVPDFIPIEITPEIMKKHHENFQQWLYKELGKDQ